MTEGQLELIDGWRTRMDIDITTVPLGDGDADDFGPSAGMISAVYSFCDEAFFGSEGGSGFARAERMPDPQVSASVITELAKLQGTGDIATYTDKDGEQSTYPGKGVLGDVDVTDVQNIRESTLADWDSATGDAFKTGYLNRVVSAIDRQREVAKTLARAMDLNLGFVKEARKSYDRLAHDSLTAAQSSNACQWFGDDVSLTLGVVAGVMAISSAVASGGLSVALGVASGTATFYQGFFSEDNAGDPVNLTADNVEGVVLNISSAVNQINERIDAGYAVLQQDGINPAREYVEEHYKEYSPQLDSKIQDIDTGNAQDSLSD